MTENELSSGWIVFDAAQIDVAGRRLFVDGAEVALEPKAFAVLLLFVGQPGRALARDDILDAVWGHRHVTPGVLNRIVTHLRHALGETGSEHRYLHTLHGIGYRFDAQVSRLDTRPSSNTERMPPSPAVDAAPAALDPDPDHSGNSGATTVIAAAETTASIKTATDLSAAAPVAAPASTAARRNRFGLAALLLVFLLAVLCMFWALHKPQLPGAATTNAALIVLPLHAVGGAADEAILAEGLSEELITRLAHIEGLRLIARTSAARAQEEKLDLNQLGERLHVTHALEGSLRQSANQLRIDLRLIEIPGGRTLWTQDYDRTLADTLSIEREVAQSVAQVLTLKLGAANAAAEANVDPQWFQEYLELRHRMGDVKYLTGHKEFVERLRALVARAPDYARAHGLLARALVPDLRPVEVSADERAEAEKEAAFALRLDPNQIEAHAALAALASLAEDWSRCFDEYRAVLKLDPSNSALRAAYAARLAGIGYVDEGLRQIDIAWNDDPLNFESITLRGWLTDVKGRHEEARPLLEMTPVELSLNRRWFNAVWRRDFAAAHALAMRMPARDKFTDSHIAASEALLDPLRWPDVQPRVAGNFAGVVQPDADPEASMRTIEALWVRQVSPLPLVLWVPELAHVRRSATFQGFLQRHHILDYWRSHGFPPQCKAEGDGAHCD